MRGFLPMSCSDELFIYYLQFVRAFCAAGGTASEKRRFGQRDSGTLRVEVHEFQASAQGAENCMARAAGRTVVPGDEQRGMVDEVVVAHGIAPRMVDRRQDDGIVGRGHRSAVTYAVGMGEARLLPAEGHYGDEPQPGEAASAAEASPQ